MPSLAETSQILTKFISSSTWLDHISSGPSSGAVMWWILADGLWAEVLWPFRSLNEKLMSFFQALSFLAPEQPWRPFAEDGNPTWLNGPGFLSFYLEEVPDPGTSALDFPWEWRKLTPSYAAEVWGLVTCPIIPSQILFESWWYIMSRHNQLGSKVWSSSQTRPFFFPWSQLSSWAPFSYSRCLVLYIY